jgi:hypothetical protein
MIPTEIIKFDSESLLLLMGNNILAYQPQKKKKKTTNQVKIKLELG